MEPSDITAIEVEGGMRKTLLEIVTWPHPALRYVARPVERIDDELRVAIRRMFTLMYEARGIGLAATQVALPFRFFVLNLTADPEQKAEERVFINPVIIKKHGGVEAEEGCLSFPGLYADVHRAKKVRVRAFNLEGEEVETEAEELLSRAVQHETDHLEGKLFIDYLSADEAKKAAQKVEGFEREFREMQASGTLLDDEALRRRLDELAAGAPWGIMDGERPAIGSVDP